MYIYIYIYKTTSKSSLNHLKMHEIYGKLSLLSKSKLRFVFFMSQKYSPLQEFRYFGVGITYDDSI